MKNILKKIQSFLTKPFTEDLTFLVTMSLLVGAVDVIAWTISGNLLFGILKGLHAYIICYCISLFGSLFRNRRVYNILLIILGIINCIVETSIRITCKTGFTDDMVAIIMGTNVSESMEFLKTYVSAELVGVILLVIIVVCLLSIFKTYVLRIGLYLKDWLAGLTFFVAATVLIYDVSYNKMYCWDNIFLGKLIPFLKYETPPDLKLYYSNPIVEIANETPENIVIIIGESLSKSHCSLFGYDKLTTPNLCALAQDSVLFAYSNVIAPATSTIPAFQSIMSFYSPMEPSDIEWYECTTFPEVMKLAGYETYWISNQSPSGMYDNIVAKYAELCDSTIWIGSKYKGTAKINHDDQIIEELQMHKAALLNDNKKCIVIHLMGSHFEYEFRYPREFEKFTISDYPEYEEHQRKRIAHYDNSVYYNDYVVSRLMSFFSDKESIIYYFPDHGQDLYETLPDHCGHALIDNKQSIDIAKQIPLYIFCSPLFQEKFQHEMVAIKSRIESNFCTDKTMEMLFDIFNIKVIDHNNGSSER